VPWIRPAPPGEAGEAQPGCLMEETQPECLAEETQPGCLVARMRCRAISYRTTVAAFAAFSELAAAVMGILTIWSQSSRHALLSPAASFPTSSSVGWVKPKSNTSPSPCSSVPVITIGQPRVRCAATQAPTSWCEGLRTTGSANSEPVLARTDLGS